MDIGPTETLNVEGEASAYRSPSGLPTAAMNLRSAIDQPGAESYETEI